jgi:hypothetical protein
MIYSALLVAGSSDGGVFTEHIFGDKGDSSIKLFSLFEGIFGSNIIISNLEHQRH